MYVFAHISVSFRMIFLKHHIWVLPRLPYVWFKFGLDRLPLKGSVLGGKCSFSPVCHTDIGVLFLIVIPRTLHAWATCLIAVGLYQRALYLQSKAPSCLSVRYELNIHIEAQIHEWHQCEAFNYLPACYTLKKILFSASIVIRFLEDSKREQKSPRCSLCGTN